MLLLNSGKDFYEMMCSNKIIPLLNTYLYNFLAMPEQISDDAGVRNLVYNSFNELETDSLVADSVTHLVTELRNNYGRFVGYTYAKNGSVQQLVSTEYDSDGRIAMAGFVHGGATKQFNYTYLNGTNLLQTLTIPNNMSLTQSFEEKLDLLTQMDYKRGNTLVSRRVYTYDALGRPLTRQTSRNGQTVNDNFVHTYRSELASAQVNGQTYAYDYDNIGNRRKSIDASDYAFYDANELNQYNSIRKNEDPAFVLTFDAAGNQTLMRTATCTWSVTYNAENRPVQFQKTTDSVTTRITCTYDYMGRRATKKVEEITTDAEENETTVVISNHRFIYRGYLQIACCDLTRSSHPCLWLIIWDPTQPVATRPLAIQKDGNWFCYGWDLTKNICEIFGPSGYIRSTYVYTPFGSVTATGDVTQPIQWSSEHYDSELALVYYNYRHYNPTDGRWINRDPIAEQGGWNSYNFNDNEVVHNLDIFGLKKRINVKMICFHLMKSMIVNLKAFFILEISWGFSIQNMN